MNVESPRSAARSAASRRSLSARLWSVISVMRRRGWLRPRRIGCALVALVLATSWMLGRAADGVSGLFHDHPIPVAGSPFNSAAPARTASSGSTTIDRIVQRGKLIVAIQEVPGLVERSTDSSGYRGFDIALLDLIAHDMGVEPTRTSFKPLPPGSREAALRRGEVDLVLGGFEISTVRSTDLSVAGPYLVRQLQLAVPAASPVGTLDSVGRGEVCAPTGSPAAAALRKLGVRLQTRATLAACADLLGGPVVAIAGDQIEIAAVRSQAPGALKVVGASLGTIEYGIGLPPEDPVLKSRLTAVLRQAFDNGTWAQLYTEYLGAPAPGPPVLR